MAFRGGDLFIDIVEKYFSELAQVSGILLVIYSQCMGSGGNRSYLPTAVASFSDSPKTETVFYVLVPQRLPHALTVILAISIHRIAACRLQVKNMISVC